MTYYNAFIILPSLSNFEINSILLTSPIESAAITPAACNSLSSSASNPGVSITSIRSPTTHSPTTTYFVTDAPPYLTSSLLLVKLLNKAVLPDPITPKRTTLNPLIDFLISLIIYNSIMIILT